MGNLEIKEPPEFQNNIHKIEEEEYLTAELENGIKGALLNNDVYLKQKLEEIQTQVNEVGQISNPNILINPDFKINQRNVRSLTTVDGNQSYTVDRWKTFQEKTQIVKVITALNEGEKSGITLQSNKEGWVLGQYTENFEDFVGKTLTISVKVKNMTGKWRIFISEAADLYHTFDFGNVENEIVKGTFMVHPAACRLLTCFHFLGAVSEEGVIIPTKSGEICIEWIKLEVGDTVTPCIPSDPATELMKCQRYYFSDSNPEGYFGYLWKRTKTSYEENLYFFPTTMRRIPTMRLAGEGSFLMVLGEDNYYALTTNSIRGMNIEGYYADYSYSGSVLVGWIEADAEIY